MRKLAAVPVAVMLVLGSARPGAVSAQGQIPNGLTGGWEVNFTLNSIQHKLLFTVLFPSGEAFFLLQDPTPVAAAPVMHKAAYATFSDFPIKTFSFSGDMDFPAGDCCRVAGSLVFTAGKSDFPQGDDPAPTMSGHVVFAQLAPTAEDPSATTLMSGDFTATRVIAIPSPVLVAPVFGAVIHRGTTVSIQWSVKSSLPIVSQQLRLSIGLDLAFIPISPTLDGTTTSYDWQVSTSLPRTRLAELIVVVTDAGGNTTGAGAFLRIK